MADRKTVPHIGVIPAQDRARSLELVFGHLSPKDRRRQIREALGGASPPDRGPLEGLVGAYRDGQLTGAMFSQVHPGKTAVVWLPRLAAAEPQSTATALLAATWEFLARRGVVLTQTLLPTVDDFQRAALRLGGLRHLANLFYLVSPTGRYSASQPALPIDFEPYCEANRERLARTIEAADEGTHDCPGLQGVRSTDDMLTGFRHAGAFDPRHWLIVRHAAARCGLPAAGRPSAA